MTEKKAPFLNGMVVLLVSIIVFLFAIGLIIYASVAFSNNAIVLPFVVLLVLGLLLSAIICPLLWGGLRILKPQEALVLTLFGKYYGTLFGAGFFFINPFVTAMTVGVGSPSSGSTGKSDTKTDLGLEVLKSFSMLSKPKKLSLKVMTLNNDKQKINDALGNPIVVGVVVVWKIIDTAKAMFNVDNYVEYLSIQCDAALRNIVRLYPYDNTEDDGEKSLRGSSLEVAEKLKEALREKVAVAGLEIVETNITHLSYAAEIAPAMLQRQQAVAVVAARQYIVDSAVGMVEMALDKLNEKNIVALDEERKAAMVSNLMVVLCAGKEAQPIVNAGTLY